ncbi:hypothetical protein ACP4OV_027964 [Aristida adscensionis]
MEVEAMLEDDVFFAELSKRISLLITDDDDADFGAGVAQFIPATVAAAPVPAGFASSLAHVPEQQGASMLAPPAYTLYHHASSCYGGGGATRAAWQQQQCGSKGTGVFIPRSTSGSAHHKKKGKNKAGAPANKAARAAQAGSAVTTGTPAKKRAAA